jgi:hypothetical protein
VETTAVVDLAGEARQFVIPEEFELPPGAWASAGRTRPRAGRDGFRNEGLRRPRLRPREPGGRGHL